MTISSGRLQEIVEADRYESWCTQSEAKEMARELLELRLVEFPDLREFPPLPKSK